MRKNEKKEKYVSMKWEIISLILPIVLCITVAVLGIIYFSSRNALIEKETSMINKESATGSATVGQWTNEIVEKVNMAAKIIQENRLGSEKEVNSYIIDHQDLIEGCDDGLYIVYADGTCMDASGEITREPGYLKEAWYQYCANNPEAAFDACSYFEEDGKAGYSVTVGRQLLDNSGKIMGIIAIDAYLDGINEQVAESKDTTDGDILVIDQKSNMVIAATQEGFSGVNITTSEDLFLQAMHTDLMSGALDQSY